MAITEEMPTINSIKMGFDLIKILRIITLNSSFLILSIPEHNEGSETVYQLNHHLVATTEIRLAMPCQESLSPISFGRSSISCCVSLPITSYNVPAYLLQLLLLPNILPSTRASV